MSGKETRKKRGSSEDQSRLGIDEVPGDAAESVPMREARSKAFYMRIEPSFLLEIEEAAKLSRMTKTEFIRQAVFQRLRR